MSCTIDNGILRINSFQLENGSTEIVLYHIDKINESCYIISNEHNLIKAKILIGLNEIIMNLHHNSILCKLNEKVKEILDSTFSKQQINKDDDN